MNGLPPVLYSIGKDILASVLKKFLKEEIEAVDFHDKLIEFMWLLKKIHDRLNEIG